MKINEPLFPDEIEIKEENDEILNSLKSSNENKLMKVGIDRLDKHKELEDRKIRKIFDIKESLKVRENLNKYYEKYKNNW